MRSFGIRRGLALAAAGVSVLAASVAGLVQLAGPRDGPGALLAIVTPHLLIVAAALGAIAIGLAASRLVALAAAFSVLVGGAVLGPEWASVPPSGQGASVTVMTWNLEFGSSATANLGRVLARTDAGVVALQEVTPGIAESLEADPAIAAAFPHRIVRPEGGVRGLALLSRWPLRFIEATADPPTLTAEVTVGGGAVVDILNVHPMPGRIATAGPWRIPVSFDPPKRDRDLRAIKDRAAQRAANGRPVILLGDLNVASSEAAYDELAAGWRDAHVEAGSGPGWTWRPSRFEQFGVGLIRIDYVFVTPDIEPVSSRQDCSYPGDHCIVTAGLRFPPHHSADGGPPAGGGTAGLALVSSSGPAGAPMHREWGRSRACSLGTCGIRPGGLVPSAVRGPAIRTLGVHQ